MSKRGKILIAIFASALLVTFIWRLYEDAKEQVVTNPALVPFVPSETEKETLALFPVPRAGKFGYINRAGEFVIQPQFDNAWEFEEGLAPVQMGPARKYGFINKNGQMVIQPRFTPQYGAPSGFQEGLARISSQALRFLRINWANAKDGFIDQEGKTVVATKYDIAGEFHEGVARVGRKQGLRRKMQWGFINRKGELVLGFEFSDAWNFSEGLAAVRKDDAFYFIDLAGQDVFGKRFAQARDFAEGLAAVKIGKKWGFINKSGETVISPQFKSARIFSEGLATIQTMDDRWGFIDRAGKIVIPANYQEADNFSEERATVRMNDRWGVIDKAGKLIITPQFKEIVRYKNGVARVGEWHEGKGFIVSSLIDKSGKTIWQENPH